MTSTKCWYDVCRIKKKRKKKKQKEKNKNMHILASMTNEHVKILK